jgi:glutathione S-transferase
MKLFGTTTSPFVRRVRVVARELDLAPELVDTATEAGQAELRKVSPIWKVPVAELDGRRIFDSRAIIEWLTATRGWGPLAPPRDRFEQQNQVNAIDGALESGIAMFYLQRDGVDLARVPSATKQRERIAAVLEWVGDQIESGRLGAELGLAELSLVCTLDWMDFRDVYPVARHPRLAALRARFAERPSLVATRPHT